MSDPASPPPGAYDQRGREGMGWRDRAAKQAAEQHAASPEGEREADLKAQVAQLEARLVRVEKGEQLDRGQGISGEGNLIALSSATARGSSSAGTIENVIIVFNGTAYYCSLSGTVGSAV